MYVTLDFDPGTATPVNAFFSTDRRTRRIAEGQSLYYEGDEAAYLYKIKTGVLRLSRVLPDGRRQVISFGFPGDIVGFPMGDCHHTDCDTLEGAELELIPARCLSDPDMDHPLKCEVLATAIAEIGGMQDHFMMLALKSAMEKTASFLLTVAGRTGRPSGGFTEVSLPMARSDIAAFLGLSIETVSRQISALKKAGLVEVSGLRQIVIKDAEALRDIAGDA